MGIGSKLLKIGAMAGGALAAPLTFGASIPGVIAAAGMGAAGAGKAASAIGSGRAQGRIAEADIQGRNDLLKLQAARLMEDALQGRAGLNLQQRQFALNAPGQRAHTSVRGDILANVQDAGIQGPVTGTHGQVPQITGGLRPSLMSGNSRQLGEQMSRDALLQQMQGDKFDPLPAISVPQITPPPKAGLFDKILGGVGLAGGIAGAFGDDDDSLLRKFGSKPPQGPGTNGGF